MRLCDSGAIHPQHSRAISFSLQFTFDYKDLFQQEPGMQTGGGGGKNVRREGVHACGGSSNFIFPSARVFPHFS